MTPSETQLFMAFMMRPNEALTYEELYRLVAGERPDDYEQARGKLKSHLSRLRQKTQTVAGREVIRRLPDRPAFVFDPIPERRKVAIS